MKSAKWLKINRIGLNLIMDDVAERMYTTKQTISSIERGKGSPMSRELYTRVIYDILKERNCKEIEVD